MSIGSVVKGSFADDMNIQAEKTKIEFDRLQTHFALSHHIYATLKSRLALIQQRLSMLLLTKSLL